SLLCLLAAIRLMCLGSSRGVRGLPVDSALPSESLMIARVALCCRDGRVQRRRGRCEGDEAAKLQVVQRCKRCNGKREECFLSVPDSRVLGGERLGTSTHWLGPE